MKWRKAPDELISFLAETTKNIDCQPRKMFGYPAYFIDNNMFLCAFQESLIIRLSEDDRNRVLKQYRGVTVFEPMPGRVMKEYVAIPESIYRNKEVFGKILKMSVKYVSGLPPKVKKTRRN